MAYRVATVYFAAEGCADRKRGIPQLSASPDIRAGQAPEPRGATLEKRRVTLGSGEVFMRISDVLHAKGGHVIKIRQTDTVMSAVQRLAEHRIGALLVEDQWMKPVGIFSERDFVNAISHHGAAVLDSSVQQLMSSPIITCHSSDRVDAILATMTTKKIRHLPVIDEGKLLGMISIGDLVKHRLDEKELEASVLLEISRMRT